MISCRFDGTRRVCRRLLLLLLLSAASGHGAEEPPPPDPTRALPDSLVLPPTRASEPQPEADAVKVRLDGEYEARQALFTELPLEPVAGSPPSLGQRSRLYHWLRLRGLALFGSNMELRLEADFPRGMLYGRELEQVPDNGTDFDRIQPVRVHPRALRLTWRSGLGEITLGHTTTSFGMGLVDADGDAPRFFGTPNVPATYERVALWSGHATSALRVGAMGDLLFEDGPLSLIGGDHLVRVGLSASYRAKERARLTLLTRYEALDRKNGRAGAQNLLIDLSGGARGRLPGRAGEVFLEYEAAYRVGTVSEPTALATGGDQQLSAFAFAARGGFALERTQEFRRFASLVLSLEWGAASGDSDPTDDELHRFSMNPNHGVGLLLFDQILRFKTARAQALLASANADSGSARVEGLATRGGVAGASYLNPVLLLRPSPDLTLKLAGVVASAMTRVIDPGALAARGQRSNFDGGSPLGRSLGSELDLGAELTLPLDAPMSLRLSLEGALAFPGSAFADAQGRSLGTQALTCAGIGLTF